MFLKHLSFLISANKTIARTDTNKIIAKGKILGMCGGGGYAISSEVLQRFFAEFESRSQFYETYMKLNKLTHFSDITTSHILRAYTNASLELLDGIHSWFKDEQFVLKNGKSILALHYASGKMQRYMDIANNRSEVNKP